MTIQIYFGDTLFYLVILFWLAVIGTGIWLIVKHLRKK